MPVSPFDDPGKSHPFINLYRNLKHRISAFVFKYCRSLYLINDVKVKLNLALYMVENTHFSISGFTPTEAQSTLKSAVDHPGCSIQTYQKATPGA